MTAQIENCRMGAKLSVESCHKRQLSRKRWLKGRYTKTEQLNPIYLSCVNCENWLSDEDYEELTKNTRKGQHY